MRNRPVGAHSAKNDEPLQKTERKTMSHNTPECRAPYHSDRNTLEEKRVLQRSRNITGLDTFLFPGILQARDDITRFPKTKSRTDGSHQTQEDDHGASIKTAGSTVQLPLLQAAYPSRRLSPALLRGEIRRGSGF